MQKQPTIGDLFTPITAIGNSVRDSANQINSNITNTNNAITGAASSINRTLLGLKREIRDAKKDVVKSFGQITKEKKSGNGKNVYGKELGNIATLTSGSILILNEINSSVGELGGLVEVQTEELSAIGQTLLEFKKLFTAKYLFNDRKQTKALTGEGKTSTGKNVSIGKIGGSKEAASAVRDITELVKSVSDLKMKDVLLFKRRMTKILDGLITPLKENEDALKSISKNGGTKEIGKLAESINEFVAYSAKTFAVAKLASPLVSKKPSKSPLAKMFGNSVYAIMTNVYGASYDEKTNTYKGGSKKNAERLTEGGQYLGKLGKSILEFSKAMALTGVLAIPGYVGAKLFEKTVPLVKSSIDAFLGDDYKDSKKKYEAAGEAFNGIAESILKLDATLALTAVLGVPALVGAALFRLTVPLVKSSIDAFLGDDYKDSKKKYETASGVLDDVGGSVLGFTAKLALTSVLAIPAMVGMGMFALLLLETNAVFNILDDNKTKKKISGGSRTLDKMGDAILGFEAGLVISVVLAPVATIGLALATPLLLGANAVFGTIGEKTNARRVRNASVSVALMGLSIMGFSLSLWASSLVTKQMITGGDGKVDPEDLASVAALVPMFGLMLGGNILYQKLGSNKSFKESAMGCASIAFMSLGLIVFSGALYITDAITKNMWKDKDGNTDPEAMAKSVAVYALMIGGIYTLSLSGNNMAGVAKGAAAAIVMGVGLAAFGIGLKFSVDAIKDVETKKVLGLIGAIAGFGVEFGVMGLASEAILLGSAAAASIGVSLLAFGFGLNKCLEFTKDADSESIVGLGKNIGKFGIEYAGIGLLSGLIAAASVSITLMGASILTFGKSMEQWKNASINENDVNSLCTSVNSVKLAFMGIGPGEKKSGIKGIGQSLTGAIGSTMDVVTVTTTAASLMIASGAIAALAKSISKWQEANITDTTLNSLCASIDRIKLAFMGVQDGQRPEGMLGKLGNAITGAIGAPFEMATVETTALALRVASGTIKSLSKSIKAWSDANLTEKDVENIPVILGVLSETFASVGGKQMGKKGLLGHLIGLDLSVFSPTDVELGVRSTMKMGRSLTRIAKGIVAFRDGIGKEFTDKTKAEELGNAIKNVITPIATAFASIAGEENAVEQKSLYGKIFGKLFGDVRPAEMKNKVAQGIRYSKDLGKTLKDLAEGVREFATIIPKNAESSWLGDVGTNIAAILTALQGPLSAMGESMMEVTNKTANASANAKGAMLTVYNSMNTVSNIAVKSKSVKAGVEAINGLGKTLKDLADATKTFAEIKDFGVAGEWDATTFKITKDGKGALGGITAVMCSMLGLMGSFGETVMKTGVYQDIEKTKGKGMFAERNKSATTKSYIGLGIQSISGIGGIIKEIGDGLKTFNDTKWKNDAMSGAASAFKVILAYMESFGTIGAVMYSGKTRYALGNTWDKETQNRFGQVSDRLVYLKNQGNVLRENADKLKTSVNSFAEVMKTISDNENLFKKVYANPMPMFGGAQNLTALVRVFESSELEVAKYHMMDKGVVREYTYTPINPTGLEAAKNNLNTISGFAKTLSSLSNTMSGLEKANVKASTPANIVMGYTGAINKANELNEKAGGTMQTMSSFAETMKNISKLSPVAENSFAKMINSINRTITRLDGKGNKLSGATKLVNALTTAKQKGVFADISKNAQKLANAINSLNNDNLKPYSEMIAALGKLSEKDSEYKKLFDDLINLLKEMNRELTKQNESGRTEAETTSGNGGNGGGFKLFGGDKKKNDKPVQQVQQTRQATDYTAVLNDIKRHIENLDNTGIKVTSMPQQ